MRTGTVYTLFLGSPGDLGEERAIAKEVVAEFNQQAGRTLGVHLELRGWEDIPPGAGRPQELINPDLPSTDVFVGLLWKRWGTPTGTSSSGFMEELDRAQSLKDGASLLDIWLFLKDIQDIEDPGDQLRQVLAFREQLKSEQKFLYKTFSNPTDFRYQFFKYLTAFFLKRGRLLATEPEGSPRPTEPAIEPLPLDISTAAAAPAVAENEHDLPQDLQAFVHAAAELYQRHLNSEALGTHEMQLMYVHKTSISFNNLERLLVLKTLVGDLADIKAGWWWFRGRLAQPERVLWYLAERGGAPAVQRGALSLLAKLPRLETPDEAAKYLDEADWEVQRAAIEVLERHGTVNSAAIGERFAAGGSIMVQDEARRMAFAIVMREGKAQALEWLEGLPVDARQGFAEELVLLVQEVRPEERDQLLNSSAEKIRSAAFERFKSELSDEAVRRFRADSSPRVRRGAYVELLSRGVRVTTEELRAALVPRSSTGEFRISELLAESDVRPLLVDALFQMPSQELEARVAGMGVDADLAYEALARRLPHARVRQDIEARFESQRNAVVASLQPLGSTPEVTAVIEQARRLEPYFVAQLLRAGISGLATSPEPEDLNLVASLLDTEPDESGALWLPSAITIFEALARAADVPRVLALVNRARGEDRLRAARLALRLSNVDSAATRSLIGIGDPAVTQEILRAAQASSVGLGEDVVLKLLDDKQAETRLEAVRYVLGRWERPRLEELLRTYIARDQYFYNVVCWLDRVLYAPGELGAIYAASLHGYPRAAPSG